jgi:hypothetical protein
MFCIVFRVLNDIFIGVSLNSFVNPLGFFPNVCEGSPFCPVLWNGVFILFVCGGVAL